MEQTERDGIRIGFSQDRKIRVVTLARAEKRNAITPAMFDELIEEFRREPSATEHATLIRAEGSVFSSGVDLSERLANGWPEESPLVTLCNAITDYPLPVVAAVQGHAIAGGAMVALHCDLVVAQEGAQLSVPLVKLGLAVPGILCARLLGRLGPALARDILLLGHSVSAETLAADHAINEIAGRAEFEATVANVLQELAEGAPLALRAHKRALSIFAGQSAEIDMSAADDLVRLALSSTDAKEGMQAKLERRPAVFVGA